MVYRLITSFILLLVFNSNAHNGKKIKCEGNYTNERIPINFPIEFDGLVRKEIRSYNKEKTNLEITYQPRQGSSRNIKVSIYPAKSLTESRLKSEYFDLLSNYLIDKPFDYRATSKIISIKQDGYKINGIQSTITNLSESNISFLYLLECGKWFYKINIFLNKSDSSQIQTLLLKVNDKFKPSLLVKFAPLKNSVNLHYAESAFRDSLMLYCTINSAYKKIEWLNDNLDSLERSATLPNYYLLQEIAGLKEMVDASERVIFNGNQEYTKDFIRQIKSMIDNNFLDEFVMEQNKYLMLTPNEAKFDYDNFQRWKLVNPITIQLKYKNFVIVNVE